MPVWVDLMIIQVSEFETELTRNIYLVNSQPQLLTSAPYDPLFLLSFLLYFLVSYFVNGRKVLGQRHRLSCLSTQISS